ncbi:MAG: hypothetical protein JW812_02475 [Alphaproteobacteria bacterium]|nr:hypothetical protein [Alphaproteobacteria bacterium]
MIDTIKLNIQHPDFKICNYDVFEPEAKGFFEPPYHKVSKQSGSIKCIQNPTKKEMRAGVYKPRLTLFKRITTAGFVTFLYIEFSAPKLIYGNNFEECSDMDFEEILKTLHEKLIEMSVSVSMEVLKEASVSAVHYAKNIQLENGVSSSLIINKISKLDISKRLDAGSTDFRNNGQAIRYHTNTYELTFYDKVKDLAQARISEKRGFEKDYQIQKDLFKNLDKKKVPEILRMEVRLGTKKKIKDMLFRVGYEVPTVSFENLFSGSISRKVLVHFWKEMIVPSLSVILLAEEDLETLFFKCRSLGVREGVALQVIGILSLIEGNGVRGLKGFLSQTGGTYRRMNEQLKNLDFSVTWLYSMFKRIGEDITTGKALKIKSLN